MNKSKFGRHVGVGKNFHGQMPPVLLHLPLERLATAPIRGGAQGEGIGSFVGGVQIDPPAGGFALNSLLTVVPKQQSWDMVTAVSSVVPPFPNTFAPGHWKLNQTFRTTAPSTGLKSVIYRKDGAAPGGGSVLPQWLFYLYSSSADSFVQYWSEFYIDEPWVIALYAGTAFTDTQLGFWQVEAHPVHLLDDNPSHG